MLSDPGRRRTYRLKRQTELHDFVQIHAIQSVSFLDINNVHFYHESFLHELLTLS